MDRVVVTAAVLVPALLVGRLKDPIVLWEGIPWEGPSIVGGVGVGLGVRIPAARSHSACTPRARSIISPMKTLVYPLTVFTTASGTD